jgi:predicted NBD/HSP70 family sugar kinase
MLPRILAIDQGGTEIRGGKVSSDGEVIDYISTDTIKDIDTLKQFITSKLSDDCKGIAFAIAATVENGRVVKSPQLPFLNGVNLKAKIQSWTSLPCEVMNDMTAAATGAGAKYPEEKKAKVITVSSGVGGRDIVEGKVIFDSEIGHMALHPSSDRLCGCGNYGCAEAFLGGESLRRQVISLADMYQLQIPSEIHPLKFLMDQFLDDQGWAKRQIDLFVENMGLFLANLQMAGRVPCMIFQGTVALNYLPRFEKRVMEKMAKTIAMNPAWGSEGNLKFIYCPTDSKHALIGAAEYFWQNR